MHKIPLALLLTASLLGSAPSPARADEAANKAAAQTLYDDAMKLMAAGKLAEACKKLEDSNRLFQGLGTRARLGECYEKSNRLASAWTAFRSALSAAETKGDARAAELRSRVAALEPRLSHLRIDVPDKTRAPGLRVLLDGGDLPESLWGTAMPVDGGVHTVEATATGASGWKTSVTVKDQNGDLVVVVEPLTTTPQAAPAATSAAPAPAPQAPAAQPPATEAAQPSQLPRRTIALALGGVGVVGLGVGGFFGLKTISKKNESNADGHCNAANVCDAAGTALRNEGKSASTLSTVFMGLGAAALVGGAVLWLTAPAEPSAQGKVRVAPQLGRDGGGLSLLGAW